MGTAGPQLAMEEAAVTEALGDSSAPTVARTFAVHVPVRYAIYPWIATVFQGSIDGIERGIQ
jgi:hypothetical protein